jgi:hypothetical protein
MHSAAPQSATPKRQPKTVGFGFWSVDAAQSIDTIVAACQEQNVSLCIMLESNPINSTRRRGWTTSI